MFGVEKWVRTQRTDRTGVDRDELPQGAEVEMEIEANAQALINMARKRLCNQASPETREVMQAMKEEVSKRDKFLAEVMVKECVYRGYCPEMNPCGYAETEKFEEDLEEYRHPIER
jgi:thymidylate synthase ThyX